jgi:hypothetical protein
VKRLLALVAVALLGGGCCTCSDAHLPAHPQRPGDVVRDLRDAVGDRQWLAASACFSEDLRTRNAPAMREGAFDWPIRPRDVVVGIVVSDGEATATIDPAATLESEPRPRQLVLRKDSEGRWHVTSWR